jgi:hypothetical protein
MNAITRDVKSSGWDSPLAPVALMVLAIVLAAAIGILLSGLGTGAALILPFAAVGAIVLGVMALVRFELFVAAENEIFNLVFMVGFGQYLLRYVLVDRS